MSSARVYPRVCGGTYRSSGICVWLAGLSPRVRGNHQVLPQQLRLRGSIPACAGEPSESASACRASRVYPRVCGGTALSGSTGRSLAGLSPRVRGNRLRRLLLLVRLGSIPACAGEPIPPARCTAAVRVYPRVCGGTARLPAGEGRPSGLSPRVRGNHHDTATAGDAVGSIPACAGEPVRLTLTNVRLRVYPRVCGGTK